MNAGAGGGHVIERSQGALRHGTLVTWPAKEVT
jgi:hypothetical protein